MLEGITNVILGEGTVYCLKPVITVVIMIEFLVAILSSGFSRCRKEGGMVHVDLWCDEGLLPRDERFFHSSVLVLTFVVVQGDSSIPIDYRSLICFFCELFELVLLRLGYGQKGDLRVRLCEWRCMWRGHVLARSKAHAISVNPRALNLRD